MLQRVRKRQDRRGFTLIEIMAVVAIIGMITAMSVPNFMQARVSANEAAAQDSLRSLYTLIEDYRFANGSYPTDAGQLTNFVDTYYKKHSVISNPVKNRGLYPGSNFNSGGSWKFQGYLYAYQQIDAGTWEWIAVPELSEVTGKRYFTINESGLVKEVDQNYADTSYNNLQNTTTVGISGF